MSELFDAVDALLMRPADLPPPAVRARLRRTDGLTQAQVAAVLGVTRVQVLRWENGQAEPRAPHRAAYSRLLNGLATKHPTAATEPEEAEAS